MRQPSWSRVSSGFSASQRRKIGRQLHDADDRDAELRRLSKFYGVKPPVLSLIWRDWYIKKLTRAGAVAMGTGQVAQ